MAHTFLSGLSESSRYAATPVCVDRTRATGRLHFGTWRAPTVSDVNCSFYVVSEMDIGRVDLISYNCYGNSSYWWAICLVNNIGNPFELLVGQSLRIPSIEAITTSLARD